MGSQENYVKIVSLEKYIQLKMTPRGLRIKKFPTSLSENSMFMSHWNQTLTDCSLKLMDLIVEEKDLMYKMLKVDIKSIREDISTFKYWSEIDWFNSILQNKINKLKGEIMEKKTQTFSSDKKDYEIGSITSLGSLNSTVPNRLVLKNKIKLLNIINQSDCIIG
ncbi:hypothetical protein XELAEV_18026969mg [Xenopus laevis]|uniref:Uncharacterized protein n=1 Tax=Xenopus laevis TaxID=8355 RepID=A0A974CX14_XENLA|nr:hypothetical protein XELAEV_18026969mg [Xenopus laevis]